MAEFTKQANFRLSARHIQIISTLASSQHVTKAAVVEHALELLDQAVNNGYQLHATAGGPTRQANFRLSVSHVKIIDRLAARGGVTKAAVVEQALEIAEQQVNAGATISSGNHRSPSLTPATDGSAALKVAEPQSPPVLMYMNGPVAEQAAVAQATPQVAATAAVAAQAQPQAQLNPADQALSYAQQAQPVPEPEPARRQETPANAVSPASAQSQAAAQPAAATPTPASAPASDAPSDSTPDQEPEPEEAPKAKKPREAKRPRATRNAKATASRKTRREADDQEDEEAEDTASVKSAMAAQQQLPMGPLVPLMQAPNGSSYYMGAYPMNPAGASVTGMSAAAMGPLAKPLGSDGQPMVEAKAAEEAAQKAAEEAAAKATEAAQKAAQEAAEKAAKEAQKAAEEAAAKAAQEAAERATQEATVKAQRDLHEAQMKTAVLEQKLSGQIDALKQVLTAKDERIDSLLKQMDDRKHDDRDARFEALMAQIAEASKRQSEEKPVPPTVNVTAPAPAVATPVVPTAPAAPAQDHPVSDPRIDQILRQLDEQKNDDRSSRLEALVRDLAQKVNNPAQQANPAPVSAAPSAGKGEGGLNAEDLLKIINAITTANQPKDAASSDARISEARESGREEGRRAAREESDRRIEDLRREYERKLEDARAEGYEDGQRDAMSQQERLLDEARTSGAFAERAKIANMRGWVFGEKRRYLKVHVTM